MQQGSFARIVRDRQLNSRQIIVEWLKDHICVSAMQMAVETDFYYSESSFRMVIWRMAHAGELEPVHKWKVYKRAEIRPPRTRLDESLRREVALMCTAMSLEQVAQFYQMGYSTVVRIKREFRDEHNCSYPSRPQRG
jgi:hypothetical protein